MKKISSINLYYSCLLALLILFHLPISAKNNCANFSTHPGTPSIAGRWDITVYISGKEYPSWLEIVPSGDHFLVGQFTGIIGSARPISVINFIEGKMSFSIPTQWEEEKTNISVEGILMGDSLKGTMILSDGKTYDWVGRKAPSLRRKKEPVWGTPVKLFNGKNLTGWHTTEGDNHWKAVSGILRNTGSGANLLTDKNYTDFKLHIEFRYAKDGGSGVYLRGRYEVQIEDDKGMEPANVLLGGVYGFIAPSEMTAKAPGEWQMFDITFIGRRISVIANGKKVICDQEIPGITGGALDSKEAEPGPIYLQGDHGPIEFRNIIITPAQ